MTGAFSSGGVAPGAGTASAVVQPNLLDEAAARAVNGRRVGALRTSALLFAALALSTAGLHTVVSGQAWWLTLVALIAVVLGAAAVGRSFLRVNFAGTAVAGLVSVVLITVIFAPTTALLGVVPTAATWAEWGRLGAEGSASITEQSVPANVTPGILFILSWVVVLIAVVGDAIAQWWRAPAIVGIPLLVILAVPSVVDPALADPLYFVLTASVYLLLLRPRVRRIQPGAAFALGAVVVAGAMAVPLILPPVTPQVGTVGVSSLTAGVNPMIDLGRDLRRASPTLALTYQTTAGAGLYLRLTTLDSFVGREWDPVEVTPGPGFRDVSALGAPEGLAASVITVTEQSSIRIGNTTGRWLPVPYAATAITGLTGDWSWEPSGLTVRTGESNMRGQEYSVESLEPQFTVAELEDAPSSSSSPLARVPSGVDPVVAQTAAQVVGDAETDYEKAIALQDFFRDGDFEYSEDAPVAEGFDGSGLDVIVPFLEAKTGYCVHFATTMAVMSRTLGIPSRVVVGFLPGSDVESDQPGMQQFEVSSRDLHAWPELYFEGAGWVRFEPTPGRGFEPQFATTPVDDPDTPDVDESQPTSTPTATPGSTADPSDRMDDAGAVTSSPADQRAAALGTAGLTALGVLALCLIPAIARLALRSRRRSAMRRGVDPARAAWAEVADTARDLGFESTVVRTPRELAEHLEARARLGPATLEALATLRAAVEAEVFARTAPSGGLPVSALAQVLRALRSAAPARVRARATLAPASLFDRVLAMRLRWATKTR